jgi:tetratricopeptide (TPR) repeat protein
MKNIKILLVILCSSLFLIPQSYGQSTLKNAAQLAQKSLYKESIEAYTELLKINQNNIEALIGRAYAYSWNGMYTSAKKDFFTVLVKDPINFEAQKGIAYIALWQNDNKNAITLFKALTAKHPIQAELFIALGQAQMNEGKLKDAKLSFNKAWELDAKDYEPSELLKAVSNQPTKLDIDIIGGISTVNRNTNTVLRLVQISSQITAKTQLSLRYDNSLSQDNLRLIATKQSIPYYAAAVFYKWNKKNYTKIETGFRKFNGAKTNEVNKEIQLTAEQIVFLQKGKSIRVGGSYISPNIGIQSYLLFVGYHQPIHKNITVGSNYFFANRKEFNTMEHRIVVDGDISFKKNKLLNIGFYYGKTISDLTAFKSNTYGSFAKMIIPVSNAFAFSLSTTLEKNTQQNLVTFNAGLRYRLEK